MGLIDLTNVKSIVNDLKTNLYLEDDLTVKFVNVGKILLEITSGWYLDKNPERELGSPEFHLLSVVDVEESYNLDKIIPLSTSVKIGSIEYTNNSYSRSTGSTKEWLVKLQTTQMKREI